ncbi:hypothetical protein [Fulvivirga lutea]|uniref:Uncharacterized protein n=1 Tax=Fulvivirga lutea TaxID=2810512 RepID=A0A974WGB2_9BACT|nr:hypothetical protein [Fulvivirga lutea]QSE97103.1 hypothetical protein JR347_16145 [Fulvivirga lutea]
MNKSIKIAFLIVMLAIPAGIFTFLKLFGNNQFQVEVFYEEGLSGVEGSCFQTEGQYYVIDSVLKQTGKLRVVAFVDTNDVLELNNIYNRLNSLFDDNVDLIGFIDSTSTIESSIFKVTKVENITNIRECHFISDQRNKLVLVDSKNRIRGYYTRDLDEIDRLIVELKIIIENDKEYGD